MLFRIPLVTLVLFLMPSLACAGMIYATTPTTSPVRGSISPSGYVSATGPATFTVTALPGYMINTVTLNSRQLLPSAPGKYTVPLSTATQKIQASFVKEAAPKLTAVLPARLFAKPGVPLTVSAGASSVILPSGSVATYTWSVSSGATVSPLTGATATNSGLATTFTSATPGAYTLTLALSAPGTGLADSSASATVVVESPPMVSSKGCTDCHQDAAYTAYITSRHALGATGPACQDCHNPGLAQPHPGPMPTNATCAACHVTIPRHSVAASTCDLCHNSHTLVATHPTAGSRPDCATCHETVAADFATSQHSTRQGKLTWYADNLGNPNAVELQKGFGNYVNVAYASLPCGKCHNAAAWTVGGVDTWPGLTNGGKMVCNDCHGNKAAGVDTTAINAPVTKATCFGCHSRQLNETSAGLVDVHFVAGMGCSSCHSSSDMHGTGTQTASQLVWGTITAQCENCHGEGKSRGPISSIAAHVQHAANIACSTCHAESMITCHNCHFDNEAGAGGAKKAKFFSGKFGGTVASGNSWRFLVNRVMPDGSTKVYPGSMQSLVADYTVDNADDGKGHTHAGIAPYYSHTITKVNALTCDKCHGIESAVKLASGVPVRVTTWNAAAGVAVPSANVQATFVGPKGVIPVPENPRGKLLMDFVDLTDPTLGAASPRVLFQKDGPDTIHMMEAYVRPLTTTQMQALAMPYRENATTPATAHAVEFIGANQFTEHTSCRTCHTGTFSMYSTSQHGTRQGKISWYNDNLNNPSATELQKGFGNYVNVAYAALPCGKCHNAAAWTPSGGTDQWQASTGGKSVCTDCHGNKAAGVDTTSVYAPVTKTTCFGCHSRQANEVSAGLTDVHFVAGMICTGCHSTTDMHGTGTLTASQLQWGTISAQCENCHVAGGSFSRGAPSLAIPEHSQHLADIACSTCHAESMITCHNCHFDNEAGAGGALKAKFFSGKFGGTVASGNSWRYLVNRVMPDGSTKVYPGSMQSLVADYTVDNVDDGLGHTHAGISPYYSHTITRVNALKCDKCHGIQSALDLNAGTPVRVTTWNAAAGVQIPAANVTATFTGPKGVIPVPENPRGKLLMDFVDLVNPALGNASSRVLFQKDGPDTIHMMEAYVKPMTAAQIQKLATPQVRP